MSYRFWKVQSVGNHFVLVLEESVSGLDLHTLSQRTGESHFGVGSDGLLVLGDHQLRMFNPDGTEDFCGNGLRCAGWFGHLHLGWGNRFHLLHGGRQIEVAINGESVSTNLGAADYSPTAVPHLANEPLFDRPLTDLGPDTPPGTFSVLSTGSAHLVARVQAPPSDFANVSREIEFHPLFPERVSVMWATALEDDLQLRIWERGVGETWGCGSGATAAAADELRRRGEEGAVTVHMRGGSVTVSSDAQGNLTVVGGASVVFEGEWLE